MLTQEEEANANHHQNHPYFVNDDESQHDIAELEENKQWRVNFLDLHNSDPNKLARAIYPEGVVFNDANEYDKYYDPHRVIRGNDNKEDKYTSMNIFRALTNCFIDDMSTMGLLLTVIKTRTKHWHPNFSNRNSCVPIPSYKPSSQIQFYCPKCINNKRFGLVANAKFRGGDPVTKESISQVSMEIVELFYHSIDCYTDKPDAYTNYMDIGYARINICFNWVFGDRYKHLVDKIENDTTKAEPHFSPCMTDKDIKQWKNKNKIIKEVKKQKDKNWKSFGVLTNAENENYNYDDRSKLLLPGYPVHQVKATDHYKSMARLMYRIVAVLGIHEEFSPYLFDEEAMRNVWDLNKTSPIRSHTGKYKSNNACHLKLKEVSVLFGGNEREICGTEPIHQFCHCVDGAKRTTLDNEKFAPGSVIVPLSEQGTSVYIRQPENLIPIPFGYLLLLKSDTPHGGITRRNNQGEQQVSIHGHLDSKNSKRKMKLSLTHVRSCYAPVQHYMLCSTVDHISAIIDRNKALRTMIEYFWKHRKSDFEKAKKQNSKRTKAIIREFETLSKAEDTLPNNKKTKTVK